MSRGGAREGAGRPRKSLATTWLAGNPGKRGKPVQERPTTAEVTSGDVDRPVDLLNPAELKVWDNLAPLAFQLRTLTPATAYAFQWLCRTVVLEQRLAAAPLAVGGPDHRGIMQRLEGLMARFRILPDGKPVVVVETPKDAFAEFDGPQLVKHA